MTADLSAIPPAMTDIERTSRAARLLARLGLVGQSASVGRGGVQAKGSRPPNRPIVPPTPTHHSKTIGRSMNIVDEIGTAIVREKQVLARMRSLPDAGPASAMDAVANLQPLFGRNDTIDRLLRVEVSYDVADEIDRWSYMNGRVPNPGRPAARILAGVSVYAVEHELPRSGWRVLNPFVPRP